MMDFWDQADIGKNQVDRAFNWTCKNSCLGLFLIFMGILYALALPFYILGGIFKKWEYNG